jgi:hypothetical protein
MVKSTLQSTNAFLLQKGRMVFFKFSNGHPVSLLGQTALVLPIKRCSEWLTIGCLVINFLFKHLTLFNFISPDKAEAGSAEEQPARNNPARYACIYLIAVDFSMAIIFSICISVYALKNLYASMPPHRSHTLFYFSIQNLFLTVNAWLPV